MFELFNMFCAVTLFLFRVGCFVYLGKVLLDVSEYVAEEARKDFVKWQAHRARIK